MLMTKKNTFFLQKTVSVNIIIHSLLNTLALKQNSLRHRRRLTWDGTALTVGLLVVRLTSAASCRRTCCSSQPPQLLSSPRIPPCSERCPCGRARPAYGPTPCSARDKESTGERSRSERWEAACRLGWRLSGAVSGDFFSKVPAVRSVSLALL